MEHYSEAVSLTSSLLLPLNFTYNLYIEGMRGGNEEESCSQAALLCASPVNLKYILVF